MSYTDWSTTAASNTSVDGTSIAEGCPPGNLNDAIRKVMAGVAELAGDVPDTSTLMPKDGGTFTGTQPKYTGRGAYLHNADSANTSGRVSLLASGSANPTSPSNGDIVFFYTP